MNEQNVSKARRGLMMVEQLEKDFTDPRKGLTLMSSEQEDEECDATKLIREPEPGK